MALKSYSSRIGMMSAQPVCASCRTDDDINVDIRCNDCQKWVCAGCSRHCRECQNEFCSACHPFNGDMNLFDETGVIRGWFFDRCEQHRSAGTKVKEVPAT